jgi:hypothetical protein
MFQDMRAKIGIGVAALGLGALGGRFLPESISPSRADTGVVTYSVKELGVQLDIPQDIQSQSVSEFSVQLKEPGTYEISVSQPGSINGIMKDRIDVVSEAQTRNIQFPLPVYDPLFTVVKIQSDGAHGPALYASTKGANLID